MSNPHDHPIYAISELRQIYGQRVVLDIPTLTIKRNEILGIVGPSGAGKSTLLRLLALLEAPTAGTVRLHLDGRSITHDYATIEDRRRISMVFQHPSLLSRSVGANVAYGLRLRGEREARQRVDAVLERVALTALADAHPRTLSGGELQRVAVARALVVEPGVLLLDEPTANLDPANVRIIESLVHEQHEQYGTTIVLVTHNIFQARRLADRVAFLLEGKLVEVAPNAQFFGAPQDARTEAFVSGELVY